MVVADLEIHSRFARACSKTLNPQELNDWAKRKGVNLLSTGDITHPLWRREFRNAVDERETGFFVLKSEKNDFLAPRFILGGEVSLMFREGEKKGRRVHLLFLAPSFEAVERLVAKINHKGKLASDGRVILSMSCREFALACQEADPHIIVIPAHIWTPWFGLLGSKSGFDSIEEAFGDQASYIRTYETGLSADPAMCWRVETLNSRVLISSSDAHSAPNMMREATLFNGNITDYSYARLYDVLIEVGNKDYYGTLEFYPQEGKYHADGHAACKLTFDPAMTKTLKGRCPKCGGLITVGVNHRVDDLASHPVGYVPKHAGKVLYSVPLQEIIAEAVAKGKSTKSVQSLYFQMISEIASEYSLLHEVESFPEWVPEKVVEGIYMVRRGEVNVIPGYDGVYGVVKLFSSGDSKVTRWGYS
ncbi:MAG TPA: endonuclease Q family protein [Patescibacteria group bacterium]